MVTPLERGVFSSVFEHRHDCAACVGCCNTLLYFHRAAYDILAAQQAFFHNKPADFVYVTETSEPLQRFACERACAGRASEDNVHGSPRRTERCGQIQRCQAFSAQQLYLTLKCRSVCNVAALANSAKKKKENLCVFNYKYGHAGPPSLPPLNLLQSLFSFPLHICEHMKARAPSQWQ